MEAAPPDTPALLLLGASLALSAAIAVVLGADRRLDPTLRRVALLLAAASLAQGLASPLLALPAAPALRWFAATGVVWLWALVRLLFDARFGPHEVWRRALPWALAGVLAPLALRGAWPAAAPLLSALWWGVAGFLLAQLLWLLVAGRGDDLEPLRRRLRLLLAGAGSVYVLLVLGWHLAGGSGEPLALAVLPLLLKLGWLALTLGHPSPLDRLFDSTQTAQPAPVASPAASPAAQQAARLAAAVAERRLYREPRLRIAELAAQLQLPEPRLRELIVDELGYRNYSAFINHFRLQEAAARLHDPAEAHLPILSIALDTGFASIGPFNRAFRDRFGCTPSEHRAAAPTTAASAA